MTTIIQMTEVYAKIYCYRISERVKRISTYTLCKYWIQYKRKKRPWRDCDFRLMNGSMMTLSVADYGEKWIVNIQIVQSGREISVNSCLLCDDKIQRSHIFALLAMSTPSPSFEPQENCHSENCFFEINAEIRYLLFMWLYPFWVRNRCVRVSVCVSH